MQIDFFLDDLDEPTLDIEWQAIIGTDVAGSSVEGQVPLEVVGARQQKLEEAKNRVKIK